MILHDVLAGLQSRDQPLAKVLHKGSHSKVLAIGFTKGMQLKEHQAHVPSKLVVVKGAVAYKEGTAVTRLDCFDEYDIPAGVPHSVEAMEDSLCLLAQG